MQVSFIKVQLWRERQCLLSLVGRGFDVDGRDADVLSAGEMGTMLRSTMPR